LNPPLPSYYLLTLPDDDEEMYEGEYGDEMEYEEDGPEDDEDNISDEDEDIEGMGPIEGLSGDHGVDVEVIMEDDDDDDDDDDDEGSSDDDDDEHDSEDDDARVEIIDEAGNIQQLDEEDIMGEWESDDDGDEGEEEDYEGEAADQEEDQLHAMEAMGGPLGHLVRALGGDEATADIIERMEAEGLGEGEDEDEDEERITGEFAEEGDEEGSLRS
jgi:E3 ubiquitin-protein ligase HUWE1